MKPRSTRSCRFMSRRMAAFRPKASRLIQSSGNRGLRRFGGRGGEKPRLRCMNPCRMAVRLIFPSPLNLPANVKLFPPLSLPVLLVVVLLFPTRSFTARGWSGTVTLVRVGVSLSGRAGRPRHGGAQRRPEADGDDFAGGRRLGRIPGQRGGVRLGPDRAAGEQENRRGFFRRPSAAHRARRRTSSRTRSPRR
jgi:hypothetical protein